MSIQKENTTSFRRLATAEAARALLTELKNISPKVEISDPNTAKLITSTSQDVLRHLQLSRKKLAQLVEDGCLSNELTNLLLTDEGFTPIEGTLLDYKRDVPTGSAPLTKLLKHIVALHNTYGGFLILGAEEVVNRPVF